MSWPVVTLGDVAETALGKMLDKGKRKGLPLVPYLRNINVQWGHISTDDLLQMELADSDRSRFGVEAGDLLVCEGGAIGRCAIWNGRSDYIAYQKALHRVRPSGRVDVRFLRYLFEFHSTTGAIAKFATGSTIAHLPQQQLRRLPVPLPAINEQRRIVETLEDHLSRLDAASTQLSQALRKTDALVASSLAMHTTRAAESKGSRSSTVGAEAILIEYGTSAKCTLQQENNDVPVIRMGNLKDGELDWENLKYLPVEHEQFPKLLLQRGDLLFNRTNSAELVGKAALFDGAEPTSFASYLIRARFKDSVDPGWANMVINSPAGRRYVASVVSQQVGQANVNGTKLKAFPLPLPGRDEQERRVAEHGDLMAARQRVRAEAGTLLMRSKLLRRSLLTAAFSGRLTSDREHLDIEELVSP